MSLSRTFVAIAALLITGPLCYAQSDQTAEPDASGGDQFASRKQYQVEVITFQYRGPDSSGGERLDRLYVEDYLPTDPFDIDEYNRVREVIAYTEVVNLESAISRLGESPYYEVLTRSAWIQPLLARDEAVEVPLGKDVPASGDALQGDFAGPSPARVSGSVSIYGDYLLFADLNLKVVQSGDSTGYGQQSSGAGSGTMSGNFGEGNDSVRTGGAEVFHINERRRIKLDEIHYFDHPHIGALLWVTRYEPSQEAAAPAE